jgi:hypothetical protein
MANNRKMTVRAGRWSALLAGSAFAASATPAEAQQWTKHFRIGMQLAINIEAEFSTSGTITFPHGPGEFDDGFVRPDITGSKIDTTNWGYQRADQFDEKTRLLTFTSTDAFRADTASTKVDDTPYIGMELAYGGPITRWKNALIGWEVGYSWLPMNIADHSRLTGVGDRFTSLHLVDGAVLLPDPPYTGSDSGEQQPVIGLEPQKGSGGFEDFSGTVTGSRTLELSLHNFRFGPTIHYEFARRWAVEGSAGGAFGFLTGDYVFKETVRFEDGTSSFSEGRISASDVVYGGYVQGVVLFHVEDHGDVYAGLQFLSLSNTEVEKGGRSAKLNLGATFSLLVGINWPF